MGRIEYMCNVCNKPGKVTNIMKDECTCGGKYIRHQGPAMGPKPQGTLRQTRIKLQRRKTKGYRRSG